MKTTITILAIAVIILGTIGMDETQAATLTNGLTLNGISFNGISFNGISFNGISFNGISFNGISFNGISFNGISFNAMSFNGLTPNCITLNGKAQYGQQMRQREEQGLHLNGIILPEAPPSK